MNNKDVELRAIIQVMSVLEKLERGPRSRVLDYVIGRCEVLGLDPPRRTEAMEADGVLPPGLMRVLESPA